MLTPKKQDVHEKPVSDYFLDPRSDGPIVYFFWDYWLFQVRKLPWYLRYPVAVGLFYLAWSALESGAVVIPLLFGIAALIAMREIAIIGAVVGILYVILIGLAALPVSVAIIISAVIVARSVKKQDQSVGTPKI
jgi:hypothetical protein